MTRREPAAVLFRVFEAGTGNCEVGCWLEPSAAGRGLVTTACPILIDWAVRDRGMHRVEWRASAANTRSLAAAERLGMTREGVLRQSYPHRGVRQDTEVWAVLAHEWPPPAAADGSADGTADASTGGTTDAAADGSTNGSTGA